MQDLTQEDLTKAIGVTRQTILAIEKGKYISLLGFSIQDFTLF